MFNLTHPCLSSLGMSIFSAPSAPLSPHPRISASCHHHSLDTALSKSHRYLPISSPCLTLPLPKLTLLTTTTSGMTIGLSYTLHGTPHILSAAIVSGALTTSPNQLRGYPVLWIICYVGTLHLCLISHLLYMPRGFSVATGHEM
jgi:hypothetical protein